MTRFDLTTRDWHELIEPVLPHASTDRELPELNIVRVEVSDGVLYGVATDRYTLAATRRVLAERCDDLVFHLDRADTATMLKLFTFSKDDDPPLVITVDKVPVPIQTPAGGMSVQALGMKISRGDGTVLTFHDRRSPLMPDVLGGWRKVLAGALHRDLAPASPSLLLSPGYLARWTKAVRGAGRVVFLAGPEPTDPILILGEESFAGVWQPAGQLDSGADELLTASPWRTEVDPVPASA